MPGALPVPFNCLLQSILLVVGIKGDFFDSAQMAFIDAQIELDSELYRSFRLTPDDRSDVRLAQTDNTARHVMAVFIEHFPLLAVDLPDRFQTFHLFLVQGKAFTEVAVDVSEIPQDVSKLPADHLSDLFGRFPPALRKPEVILPGFNPVCSGHMFIVVPADPPDDTLQFFSCLIQKRKSCGKRISEGAQVASRIRVPVFVGCTASFSAGIDSEDGDVELLSVLLSLCSEPPPCGPLS